ncbi:enoyl-CoA hydratase-related protein [Streptomyces mirabilis]|nr:enoyl-CoA hydratase-related protein [Streptomyces mirabilis]
MTGATPEYFTAFKNIALSRTDSGVLTLRFHTDGGPATFSGQLHTDFPRALFEIGEDRDNRVLVLTGTGDRFMTEIDGASLGDITKPSQWDRTVAEGRRVMQRLVDLEMPIVAAVNGPASVHSEYALLADIVVAADTTVFSDFPHLTFGIVPGDGIQIAWEEAIGVNRTRYLTLTQGSFTADQAERWGAVAEVLPPERVLPGPRNSRSARRQAATAHPLSGRHPATADQPPHGRGTQLGMALEGPHRRRPRVRKRGRGVTAADRWIGALHESSERLGRAVADLPADRLAEASYAEGWTIGQVLSHLGSGAEISMALVERGLKGDERGPVREELLPVWERWDALSPSHSAPRGGTPTNAIWRSWTRSAPGSVTSARPVLRRTARPGVVRRLPAVRAGRTRLGRHGRAGRAGGARRTRRGAALGADRPGGHPLPRRRHPDPPRTAARTSGAHRPRPNAAPRHRHRAPPLPDPAHRPHRPPDRPRGVGTAAGLRPQSPPGPPGRHRLDLPRRPADALPRFLTALRSATAVTAHSGACDPPRPADREPSGSPRPEERWNHEHFTRNHSRSRRERHRGRHL